MQLSKENACILAIRFYHPPLARKNGLANLHGVATAKETVEFILGKLRHEDRFTARAMFGEYALYADGKTVKA